MMPTVSRSGDLLVVRAPFDAASTLRSLFGSRWNRSARAWTLPATPAAAQSLRDALGVAPFADDAAALALLAEADAARVAQVVKVATTSLDPLPFEPTSEPPWRHQLAAVRFSESLPASLWHMGMGTGKTRAALDLIRLRDHRRVLVIAPKAVIAAWPVQAKRHAPAEAFSILPLEGGSTSKRASTLLQVVAQRRASDPRCLLAVVNYDAFWRSALLNAISRAEFDCVIFDEIHRVKAPRGRASVAAAKLARSIPHRLGLTGTLMPHSPMDVYGSMRALDPGIFGTSFVAFRSRYGIMGGYQGRQVVRFQNLDELAARVATITFEAGRDVLDLPDAVHVERTFALPPRARQFYDNLRRDLVADLEAGRVTADNALTRLLRLMQVAAGHVGYDLAPGEPERRVETLHEEKLDQLAEIIEDTGEPLVVFCLFRHDIDQAHDACNRAGVESSELSGRRNELAAWQSGETRVLVAQMQSGSEGVDLTRARYCVFWSLGYSLGRYDQALARVHRPGQTRPVTYIHLIAEGTVDRIVRRALSARRSVVEDVIAAIRAA